MKALDHKWRVIFEGVDQGELLAAVRGNDRWRDAVLDSRSRTNDEDEWGTIRGSIPVATLTELMDLLTATKDVRADYGVMLHLSAKDGPLSFGATLASSTAYEASSASVSHSAPKQGENPTFDALRDIYHRLADVIDEVRIGETKHEGA